MAKSPNKKDNADTKPFFSASNKPAKNRVESKHAFSVLRMLSKMIGVGFSLFYVGFILSVWFFPEYYDVALIYNLTLILIFEFILVHSGVFMSITRNIKVLIFFALLYGLFAFAINFAVLGDSPLILYLYSFTVLNRMIYGLSSRTDKERQENMGYSVLMAMNFMFCICLVLMMSWLVPYGGLTPEYLNAIDYYNLIPSGGEFPEKPHIAFAFGVLYFGLPVVLPLLFKVLSKKTARWKWQQQK